MKFRLVLLCVTLLVCLTSAASVDDKALNSIGDEEEDIKLPKVFDFFRFKTIFKKNYKSFVEELARQKIFLGRAFKAFISLVGYKHHKKNYYLGINDRSDWTEAEQRATYNKRPRKNNKIPIITDPNDHLDETPVANIEDIKAKLNEISDKPEYANVINELKAANRKRRSLVTNNNDDRSSVSVDDLITMPDDEEEEDDGDRLRVPSNNPNYEPPELSSCGAEDEKADLEMNQETSNVIAQLPGAQFVGSLLSAAGGYLFGDDTTTTSKPKDPSDLVSIAEIKVVESTPKENKKKPKVRVENENNEILIDHRDCFVKPKNQRNCGSCYIFSSTSLYEWNYCKETGEKVAFSEQYPLDCGEKSGLVGCDGGQESSVAEFYGAYGLMLKKDYPYKFRSDICPYEEDTDADVMGYLKLRQDDGGMVGVKFDFMERYLAKAPLAIGILVFDDFTQYSHGIYDGSGCNEERQHSMVIVGTGIENDIEYYILRNSYGPTWGEKGYFRLAKEAAGKCFMDEGISYYIRPRNGKNIFKTKPNSKYHSTPIEKRFYDLKNKVPIPHNPFTYIDPNDMDANAVVNSK